MKINEKKSEKLLQKMQKVGITTKNGKNPSKRELSRRSGLNMKTIALIFAGQSYKCDFFSVLRFCFILGIKKHEIGMIPIDDEGKTKIYAERNRSNVGTD